MNVEQIMTSGVGCCGRETSLRDCAQMMVKYDCGCIPVTEDADGSGRVVGVITDRDIACRAVAAGMDPNTTTAGQCMSPSPMTVRPGMSLDEAERIMGEMQVRRVPVVGADGSCLGMISMADIAMAEGNDNVANMIKDVSRPYVA